MRERIEDDEVQPQSSRSVIPINLTIHNNSKIVSHETKEDEPLRKMLIITLICTLFLIAEVIGGLISHSLAILSDAAHLCSDLSGFVISIIALCISRKKANKIYTFGYYRAEVIGALISVVTIWLLTGLLLKEAIDRLINPSEIYAPVMLLTAILGLICNLAMMKVLHNGHGHSHACSHSHSHGADFEHIDDSRSEYSTNELKLEVNGNKRNNDEEIEKQDMSVISKFKSNENSPENSLEHDHGHYHSNDHSHTHSNNQSNNHSHDHSHNHSHDHSHNNSHDNSHNNSHEHSHNQDYHKHTHDSHGHSYENPDTSPLYKHHDGKNNSYFNFRI
jgi:zinc transporter 2